MSISNVLRVNKHSCFFAGLALAFFAMSSVVNAEPVKVGDSAPVISGVTDSGATLNFADVYKANKYTLVYFYPKADTRGCTAQGCSIRDAYEALTKAGVAVIGVSVDSVDEQKAFKAKYSFQFTLIADTDKKVKNAFGVPGDLRANRQAYLVKGGKIIYADYKGSTTKQADDILTVIAKDS